MRRSGRGRSLVGAGLALGCVVALQAVAVALLPEPTHFALTSDLASLECSVEADPAASAFVGGKFVLDSGSHAAVGKRLAGRRLAGLDSAGTRFNADLGAEPPPSKGYHRHALCVHATAPDGKSISWPALLWSGSVLVRHVESTLVPLAPELDKRIRADLVATLKAAKPVCGPSGVACTEFRIAPVVKAKRPVAPDTDLLVVAYSIEFVPKTKPPATPRTYGATVIVRGDRWTSSVKEPYLGLCAPGRPSFGALPEFFVSLGDRLALFMRAECDPEGGLLPLVLDLEEERVLLDVHPG